MHRRAQRIDNQQDLIEQISFSYTKNSPKLARNKERQSFFDETLPLWSILLDMAKWLDRQEVHRVTARATYYYWRRLGWRKVRHRDGRDGNKWQAPEPLIREIER